MSYLHTENHPFFKFQISERLAARCIEKRNLTPTEMKNIVCSAEWRNALNVQESYQTYKFLSDKDLVEIESSFNHPEGNTI